LSPARRCQRITRGRGKDEYLGKEVIAKKPGRDALWRYTVEPLRRCGMRRCDLVEIVVIYDYEQDIGMEDWE
jgi:hypothetical protein